MGEDGGTKETTFTCARDGVETRLRCAECETPICPACFIRTDVGLMCPTCAAPAGPPIQTLATRRRRPGVGAAAMVLALIVGGGAWAATRSGSSPAADDVSEGGERIIVPSMTLGQGDLPDGRTWTSDARREGGVCTTLTITSTPPLPERCLRTGSYRAVGNLSTRIVRSPSGTTYVTVGQVSDRSERVRVAPDGSPFFEVPVLGAGSGLDVRFFVAVRTANVPVSFTVYGADGIQLGRADGRAAPKP